MTSIDPEDIDTVAPMFGIANAMARNIVDQNDEGGPHRETPEARWQRMRKWIASQIMVRPSMGANKTEQPSVLHTPLHGF